MQKAILLPAIVIGTILGALRQRADGQGTPPMASVDSMNGVVGRALHARMLTLADSGWSGAVIVVRGDSVLLQAGYGMANRERRIPFTAATIAQVGSLTKQFTATAVVDLVRRGQLRLSDSLGALFDGVPTPARGITVDMLLSHRAGLPQDCARDFSPLSKNDLIRVCLAKPLTGVPGKSFSYSNLGYSILGAIIEKTTGETQEAYLQQHLLGPLHLDDIGYQLPHVPAERLALGYGGSVVQPNIRERIARLGADYWNLKGNGGMQASVVGMHAWWRALEGSSIITDDMKKALFSPHAERDGGSSYGYGWFLRMDSLGRTIQVGHSGSDGTFEALWYWRPLERLFIYSVSNFGQNNLSQGTVAALRDVLRQPDARDVSTKQAFRQSTDGPQHITSPRSSP